MKSIIALLKIAAFIAGLFYIVTCLASITYFCFLIWEIIFS